MARNRRSLSVVSSFALGLGAAALVLLAGGRPAAAAPVDGGDGKPAPAPQCFARDDSATGTVYSSGNSAAVRQAVAAAAPNDFIRLAGTCSGVAAQLGTTQTVAITQPLTLEGGYSIADWADSFPISQPTTLDALSQGRVITASANFTISALTVQHGYSGGGSGGGIFAGNGLTAINPVNILSNTTLLTPTLAGAMSPAYLPSGSGGHGGGLYDESKFPIRFVERPLTLSPSLLSGNEANDGGAIDGNDIDLTHVTLQHNHANLYGGAVNANGTLHTNNVVLSHNSGVFGGAISTFSGATMQNTVCDYNNSADGGCWTGQSENQVNFIGFSASYNAAQYGAVGDAFGPTIYVVDGYYYYNLASYAGGTFFLLDSNGNLANNLFIGNYAPKGSVVYSERLLRVDPLYYYYTDGTNWYYVPGAAGPTTGSANPVAASTAPTGSAFYASGVTVFITDTIVAGYALDLETSAAPSTKIQGDYNLFDHTPVISGTNITTGTHSLVGNPLFADALGHLSAGSPAINHGIDVGLNTDLDGNSRPSGAGFDIGAYEFQFPRLFLPLVRR